MKVNGKSLKGPRKEVIVFPRQDGDLAFWAEAVLDFSPFEGICPEPKVPSITFRGETIARANIEDPEYKKAVEEWQKFKRQWMFLKSLSGNDLVWETIDMADPSTWGNVQKELLDGGFNPIEAIMLTNHVFTINGVSPEKMDEARSRFLALSRQQSAP